MKIYTIGFTKKSAETFFGLLKRAGVRRIVDVRLNNVSQLAGFAKRADLRYFSRMIGEIGYVHLPELAPTKDMLDEYRKKKSGWQVYEQRFLDLMADRRIEESIPRDTLEDGCLLCSEDKPHKCHRRLVAEYLKQKWGTLDIEHLM